jgi:hypothetical protein
MKLRGELLQRITNQSGDHEKPMKLGISFYPKLVQAPVSKCIPSQQKTLKENHASSPDHDTASKKWQQFPCCDQLKREQKESADKNRYLEKYQPGHWIIIISFMRKSGTLID